jgi:hypothetical protein
MADLVADHTPNALGRRQPSQSRIVNMPPEMVSILAAYPYYSRQVSETCRTENTTMVDRRHKEVNRAIGQGTIRP